ncbi:hypothetical protein [Selenomonas sp. KH1T6]|uniref:hypothetical protein n=1 Tax=Selenomonas sp. KH1T6 TaxID=3158784 RepID=UPI0008A7CB69|nr:hypothetical protein SAMN05216583_10217 [Selenomonas ruminantium]
MKNQYFGDIGDYGKYGLLRFLAGHGETVAVNWYLTKDDQSNDGNIRDYLTKEKDRRYDPNLFDVLKRMSAQNKIDVCEFAALGMIPGAGYFDKIVEPVVSTLTISEKRATRKQWHREALAVCEEYDLVFLDPDNGLRAGIPTARKDAMKYVYSSEVADYYERGQDVVYYCHKGRRTNVQWEKAKHIMQEQCPNAMLKGITFHRGTQRSYIFVIHPESEKLYRNLLKNFLETAWSDCFTDEFDD